MNSLRTPREVNCINCNHTFDWMYNDCCPNCKTDVEFTLEEYEKQIKTIKQQYKDHCVDQEDYTEWRIS